MEQERRKTGYKRRTHILQHLDLARQHPDLVLVLALQLLKRLRTILAPRIRRRAPVPWGPDPAIPHTSWRARICAEPAIRRQMVRRP